VTELRDDAGVGIRAVSELVGLSVDSLRWYEREGLLPRVERAPGGRRQYTPASIGAARLVQALRRTGMSVADVRRFVELSEEGAASHGRRMALLDGQAAVIEASIAQLTDDLGTVQRKIAHYQQLIDQGLDCDGEPIDDPAVATRQREGARR
jgi:DNA-binding transcriptional MerR regulator